jgi:hypothetical protein
MASWLCFWAIVRQSVTVEGHEGTVTHQTDKGRIGNKARPRDPASPVRPNLLFPSEAEP